MDIMQLKPLISYVSCVYNGFWWIGMVTEINENEGDAKIEFLHPHGPRKTFNWPSVKDTCYVPLTNIQTSISTPITTLGRTYEILGDDFDKIILAYENYSV